MAPWASQSVVSGRTMTTWPLPSGLTVILLACEPVRVNRASERAASSNRPARPVGAPTPWRPPRQQPRPGARQPQSQEQLARAAGAPAPVRGPARARRQAPPDADVRRLPGRQSRVGRRSWVSTLTQGPVPFLLTPSTPNAAVFGSLWPDVVPADTTLIIRGLV